MPKISEDKFIEVNEKWGSGFAVEVYKNEYSIIEAKRGKDGNIWGEWCYPQVFEDGERGPGKKTRPIKITIGVKEQAIQRLEQLIYMIEGRDA